MEQVAAARIVDVKRPAENQAQHQPAGPGT